MDTASPVVPPDEQRSVRGHPELESVSQSASGSASGLEHGSDS